MFGTQTRVIVVDDFPPMRSIVRLALSGCGLHDVIECADGQEAFETILQAETKARQVGLVVSDYRMPRLDGLELCRKLRARPQTHELAFVMITSEADDRAAREALKAGVSAYLPKPFEPNRLAEVLASVHRKHRTHR